MSARVRSTCAALTGMHAVLLQHNTESLWSAMQAAMPGGNRCKLANHALQTMLCKPRSTLPTPLHWTGAA